MLTTAQIERLKPRSTRYTVTHRRGLGIEVMPSGLKIWRYRLGSQRATVGRWPGINLKKAIAWLDKWDPICREQGVIPTLIEGPGSKQTVQQFSARYIKEVLERDRKNPKQLIAMLKYQVCGRLGKRVMSKVSGAEARELIFRKRDEGKPAAAAALRNLIKRLWDYAIVCGVATVNPAAATPLKFIQRLKTRERTLSRRELKQVVITLIESGQLAWRHTQALMLMLLTMCRKSELLSATWAEFDLEAATWEIPAEHSKTGKAHIVYLSRQALEILKRREHLVFERLQRRRPEEYVFPAHSSPTQPMSATTLNRVLARVNFDVSHFTIHDLRRTAATLLSEEGWPADVIEKALNHTIKGVRGVYNRAEYGAQRKEMLQAWADLIDKWRREA